MDDTGFNLSCNLSFSINRKIECVASFFEIFKTRDLVSSMSIAHPLVKLTLSQQKNYCKTNLILSFTCTHLLHESIKDKFADRYNQV